RYALLFRTRCSHRTLNGEGSSVMALRFLLAATTPDGAFGGETFRGLVELAFQYGPFLFSLVFLFFITRWACTNYADVCRRKDALPGEKRTHQCVFIASFLIAVFLVMVSVTWWFKYRPSIYVFRGEIAALKEYEHITSPTLYLRTVRTVSIDSKAPEERDEQFIIVQEKPFASGDEFELKFSKGEGHIDTFTVPFTADQPNPRFAVKWDEPAKNNVLNRLGHPRVTSLFSPVLFAAGTPATAFRQLRPAAQSVKAMPSHGATIETLQDERSLVGSKIGALNQLAELPRPELERVVTTATSKEPMLVTLIDLSRHTDKEIAYYARRILD